MFYFAFFKFTLLLLLFSVFLLCYFQRFSLCYPFLQCCLLSFCFDHSCRACGLHNVSTMQVRKKESVKIDWFPSLKCGCHCKFLGNMLYTFLLMEEKIHFPNEILSLEFRFSPKTLWKIQPEAYRPSMLPLKKVYIHFKYVGIASRYSLNWYDTNLRLTPINKRNFRFYNIKTAQIFP